MALGFCCPDYDTKCSSTNGEEKMSYSLPVRKVQHRRILPVPGYQTDR